MRIRHYWLPVGAAAVTLALLPGTAFGWGTPGKSNGQKTDTRGGQDGGRLYSMITFSGSAAGGGGDEGRVTPVGDWTPPACWYEPRSAADFSKYVENMYTETINTPGQHSYAKASVGMFRNDYKDGTYKNYNLDIQDEGNWWVAVVDQDRWMEPAAQVCDKQPFWVENGDAPPVDHAVTPQILAELAYNRVRLPATEVSLAPQDTTKVNLPTWAWLDKARFKPVSVTAALDVGGVHIQATTTAEPVALKLEPGTPDATTSPGSGECTLNADDSVGEPYAKGKADRTPPCGVTYLRSSGNGTFKLRATVTWRITWTGTGNPDPKRLPDGTFGNDQAVTVQEIQSVNR
ncbi:hypothetical protein ACJ6WF_24590 [Streptomyces sp. MMS24-I2-30]|uniref:hypothetical protein n=1 Tax=Streptomyces sp. MMS24-I2-30 TaxID=3351564 RepID=UPI003896BD63